MSEEAAPYHTGPPKVRQWTPEEVKSATDAYTAWRPFVIHTRDGRQFAFTDAKSFHPTENFRVIYYMGPGIEDPRADRFLRDHRNHRAGFYSSITSGRLKLRLGFAYLPSKAEDLRRYALVPLLCRLSYPQTAQEIVV